MSTLRLTAIAAAMSLASAFTSACSDPPPSNALTASGNVEATEVQVAPEVGGRVLTLTVAEGDRVAAGAVIATLDTRDVELQIARARADRAAASAQLRLFEAGSRVEDVRQAEAQVEAAAAELGSLDVEIKAAQVDLTRFESLLAANAGSQKQRDDAKARVDLATERRRSADERVRVARATLDRVRAGARREELDGARARVASVDAQIAVFEKSLNDAQVTAPAGGLVTQKLVDAGELVAPRTPLVVVTDLDHAWANVFVPEPMVPRLKMGQEATVRTDAGSTVKGTITFISPRAEFTPRNVQTADERSKLVYRVKVTVDNSAGVLKQGMPVDADFVLP
jgi:HlyD family secretion protein